MEPQGLAELKPRSCSLHSPSSRVLQHSDVPSIVIDFLAPDSRNFLKLLCDSRLRWSDFLLRLCDSQSLQQLKQPSLPNLGRGQGFRAEAPDIRSVHTRKHRGTELRCSTGFAPASSVAVSTL